VAKARAREVEVLASLAAGRGGAVVPE
jgi:hypothetical protein